MCLFNFVVFILSLSYVQCSLNLTEGSPCTISDNKNGTCVNLYKCNSAATTHLFNQVGIEYSAPDMPPMCSLRPNGEPVVCCADCSLDEAESLRGKAVMPRGIFFEKTGPTSWLKCMEFYATLPYPCRGSSRVSLLPFWDETRKCQEPQFLIKEPGVGGVPAEKNQFPHMALLGYGPSRNTAQWLCGGSVISERYILTAGHCSSVPNLGPISYAGLGVLERRDLSNFYKVYKIISVIVHPEYKPPSKYNDIAIIKTENEINFGRSILPACLHVAGNFTVDFAEAPGWGKLGSRGQVAEHLQVMYIDKYNETECSAKFPPHRHLRTGYDHNTQMCFGRRDEIVDTCEGDSGGPLQSLRWQCMHLLVGVTSFGKDCGIRGYPGVYTRVSHYLPWIESIVWPDE